MKRAAAIVILLLTVGVGSVAWADPIEFSYSGPVYGNGGAGFGWFDAYPSGPSGLPEWSGSFISGPVITYRITQFYEYPSPWGPKTSGTSVATYGPGGTFIFDIGNLVFNGIFTGGYSSDGWSQGEVHTYFSGTGVFSFIGQWNQGEKGYGSLSFSYQSEDYNQFLNLEIAPVPEPSTLFLVLPALVPVIRLMRRHRI